MARTTAGSSQPFRRSPGLHTDIRTSSPNYFSLTVDPSNEGRNSVAGPKDNWSSPTSSIRSFNPQSPINMAVDANPEYEAFRKQSEAAHAFNLGRASLHNISTPPISSPYSTFKKPTIDIKPTSPRGFIKVGRQTDDRMDLDDERDSAYESADSLRPESTNTPSFFDMPRHASPASIGGRSPPPMARSILSRLEDRHPRLSLPGHKVDPPSPRIHHQGASHARADTLPSTLEAGPAMILPLQLQEIIENMGSNLLLLDLRVSKQFSDSRIRGALNLCLPTTLLKRVSFNLQKLLETFDTEEEKENFLKWKQSKCIVVYDNSSAEKSDATSGVHTLNKFINEGWKGRGYILRGGFSSFAKSCPQLVDRQSGSEPRPSKMNLSLGTSMPAVAPVAGGCDMPTAKGPANPFFSNIRQNQDLIGGVGQIAVKQPEDMDERRFKTLPRWLRTAASPDDCGKKVSDKFHKIEVVEQARMTEALSTKVSYGTPDAKSKSVRIAGFEKGSKNRYNNIWPFEHARVKLKKTHGSSDDYFNASHITSFGSDKTYIASQGPLPTTYQDFWSVIWDYDVRVIVMLTAESEGGQLKCHNYWSDKSFGPYVLKSLSEKRVSLDGKHKHHRHESTAAGPVRDLVSSSSSNADPLKLRKRAMTNVDDMPPIIGSTNQPAGTPGSEPPFAIIRKFSLSHAGFPFNPMREITQVHYTSWPDFGAPAQPSQVLALVELCSKLSNSPIIGENVEMKSAHESTETKRPVLVHCSAGCGRTGTFCTIDSVLDMLKKQAKEKPQNTYIAPPSVKSPLNPVHELPSSTNTPDFFSSAHNNHHINNMASIDTEMTGMGNDGEDGRKDEEENDWLWNEDVDLVEKTVTQFREQRLSMVQSLKQYVLCYETVLEWLIKQKGSMPAPQRPGGLMRTGSGF